MSSIIKTHKHDNYDILKEFTEASGTLLYKGKPINADTAVLEFCTEDEILDIIKNIWEDDD